MTEPCAGRGPGRFQVRLQAHLVPGCGDYTVLGSVTRRCPASAAAARGGGGPASAAARASPAYTTCYGFHGVHGRALAAGTGRLARPDPTVLVVTGGDGDGYSIGGNHFLHACRRNVDMTYIVMDNHVRHDQGPGLRRPPSPTGTTSSRPAAPASARSIRWWIALAAGANFIARAFSAT